MPKIKTSKNQIMQPGDAADYEAEAHAYFESLRQPFEQTLAATRKDRPRFVLRLLWLVAFVVSIDVPFISTRIVGRVFHENTYTIFGKSHSITETAGLILFWCVMAIYVVAIVLHGFVQQLELRHAVRPLSQRAMVFALSYAILREVESLERSNLTHHRQVAIKLWTKMLTYLRWRFQGKLAPDDAHFHRLPKADYLVAPNAEHLAMALNWDEVRKSEYDVAVALNSLHSKISPRLKDGNDFTALKTIFRGLGNFFYTTIVQQREAEAAWGYGELLRAVEVINGLPAIPKTDSSKRPRFSVTVFTHPNLVVAILSCWLVVLVVFIALLATAFRFFPSMTMNSQAMITLIGTSMVVAISIVGITRKKS